MITPTVGRVVWYHPVVSEEMLHSLPTIMNQPLAAIVAGVWSDTCVNLAVFDANGNAHSRTSVLLVQDGEPIPGAGNWCEWMPYQKGQAAKTEKLEEALAVSATGLEHSAGGMPT
jgi:hypothetical protein